MSRLPGPALLAGTLEAPPLSGDSALLLLQQVQVGLFVDQDGVIAYVNPALAAMVGWLEDELIGLDAQNTLVTPEYREPARAVVRRRLEGKTGRPGDMRFVRRDGSTFDARVHARRIDFDGRPAVLVTVTEIGELKQALQRAEWHAGMLARSESLCRSGSFEIILPSGEITVSAGLRALVGLPAEAEEVQSIDALSWVPEDERALVAGIWRCAVQGEPIEFQHRVVTTDGRRLTVRHIGLLSPDPDGGNGAHGVAIVQDITSQREAEARIEELSTHDEVTGLPNRKSFLDQVDAAMHAARWGDAALAMIAIDVPRIADIKSSMGFGAGDALAMALAARLSASALHGEVVARLGETEFAVLIEVSSADALDAIRQRAEALLQALQSPVTLGVTDVFPRGVVGLARFPGDAEHAEALVEAAQNARLEAAAGPAGLAFYKPESATRAVREMQVEAALRRALAANEFELHYQAQVSLSDGRIRGAESLLRWTSPDLGAVPPAEFIPVAERVGLIGAIGDWVLQRACQQAAVWRKVAQQPVRVGVNLSPAQLQRPDLARHVQAMLVAAGAHASNLTIEVTESVLMADVERAAQVLHELKAIGVEIALDDFGTGFSSLSWLCRLPLDVLKIDRSFVHDVTAAAQDVSVTRAIIRLAHTMKLEVLAEGVETEGQLSLLLADGCDSIQGYYFARPVPAAEFEALLTADKRLPPQFVARARRTRTLLLVDDEDNILAALKRTLRRDGYHIVTACNAAEGLQRLTEHEVDVIVSDQRMPGMTGVEFLRRAKDLYPHTVRMVLSGYTELQSIIDAVNEGAIYKFLTKPWDDERLRAHVAEAFQQKGMADENRRLSAQVESANADLAGLNARLEHLLEQQRQHAELMQAQASQSRDLIDELPAAVLGVDPEGLVVMANRKAETLWCEAGGLLGREAGELVPGWSHDAVDPNSTVSGGLGDAPAAITISGRVYRMVARPMNGNAGARGSLLLFWPADDREDGHP
jgi:PAS domain S-box-containing protein/diguanylate cyclase (GGDEF)-like protein